MNINVLLNFISAVRNRKAELQVTTEVLFWYEAKRTVTVVRYSTFIPRVVNAGNSEVITININRTAQKIFLREQDAAILFNVVHARRNNWNVIDWVHRQCHFIGNTQFTVAHFISKLDVSIEVL